MVATRDWEDSWWDRGVLAQRTEGSSQRPLNLQEGGQKAGSDGEFRENCSLGDTCLVPDIMPGVEEPDQNKAEFLSGGSSVECGCR